MRKLLAAVAIAAVATLGLAGHASAQVFYPKTPTTPSRVGGVYGYPSQQYPTYPGQYSTPSHKKHHDNDKARRDRDRDDDDRRWDNARDSSNRQHSSSGYGTSAGAYGAPSRVGGHDSPSQSPYGNSRDRRWDRNGR